MKRVLSLSRWPAILVFVLAGVFGIVLAFSSFNLLTYAMKNLEFLGEHGWEALRLGGALQLLQLLGNGCVALAAFMGFKACESDLIRRYTDWQKR